MDNEELTLFRDMARRAFEQEISPNIEAWEEQHIVPREMWNTLGAAGLLCPDMPAPSSFIEISNERRRRRNRGKKD